LGDAGIRDLTGAGSESGAKYHQAIAAAAAASSTSRQAEAPPREAAPQGGAANEFIGNRTLFAHWLR
jgi:hypothetical protein